MLDGKMTCNNRDRGDISRSALILCWRAGLPHLQHLGDVPDPLNFEFLNTCLRRWHCPGLRWPLD